LRTPTMAMIQSLSCASATRIPRLASCMKPACDMSFSPSLLRCSPPASPSLARRAPTHAHANVWNPLMLFVCARGFIHHTAHTIRQFTARTHAVFFFPQRGALFGGRCTTTIRWKNQHSWKTTSVCTKRTWKRSSPMKTGSRSTGIDHAIDQAVIFSLAARNVALSLKLKARGQGTDI